MRFATKQQLEYIRDIEKWVDVPFTGESKEAANKYIQRYAPQMEAAKFDAEMAELELVE